MKLKLKWTLLSGKNYNLEVRGDFLSLEKKGPSELTTQGKRRKSSLLVKDVI